MKKVLVIIVLLGFGFSANAERGMELQINGGFGGTEGGVTMSDKDFNGSADDSTAWSLGVEVYKTMNDNIQVGGLISISDADATGRETAYTLGVTARYNFDSELRDSMFVGAGLSYTEVGIEAVDSTRTAVRLNVGKRYALSDTITYTPNVSVQFNVGGDTGFDEGTSIAVNLLSFSGFM